MERNSSAMQLNKSALGFRLDSGSVNPAKPLLYRIWTKANEHSDETTIYVGQTATGFGRPFSRYDLNIRRLIDGKGPLNGRRFRSVHLDMHAAHRAGHLIGVDLGKRPADPPSIGV